MYQLLIVETKELLLTALAMICNLSPLEYAVTNIAEEVFHDVFELWFAFPNKVI